MMLKRTMFHPLKYWRFWIMGSCLFIAAFPHYAQAKSPSKIPHEPIDILSERGNFNHRTGTAQYQGNVFLTQGSRQLWADTLSIHRTQEGKIDKMEATGNPARFEALLDPQKPKLLGHARKIEYYPRENRIVLIHEAELIQREQSIRGPHIEYALDKRILSCESNASGRTTLVLKPKEE